MTLGKLFEVYREHYTAFGAYPVVGRPYPRESATAPPNYWSVLGAWIDEGPEGLDDGEVLIRVGEQDYDGPPLEQSITIAELIDLLAEHEASRSDWPLEMTSACSRDENLEGSASDESVERSACEDGSDVSGEVISGEDTEGLGDDDLDDEEADDDDDDWSVTLMRIDYPVIGIGIDDDAPMIVLFW
jgi:hypothetical protein